VYDVPILSTAHSPADAHQAVLLQEMRAQESAARMARPSRALLRMQPAGVRLSCACSARCGGAAYHKQHIFCYHPETTASLDSKLPHLRTQAPTYKMGSCARGAMQKSSRRSSGSAARAGTRARALLCCSTECASGRSAPRRSGDTFVFIQQMSSQRRKPHLRRQCRPASRPSALPHLRRAPRWLLAGRAG